MLYLGQELGVLILIRTLLRHWLYQSIHTHIAAFSAFPCWWKILRIWALKFWIRDEFPHEVKCSRDIHSLKLAWSRLNSELKADVYWAPTTLVGNNVFSLISASGACLISKLKGAALIGGWRLKEGGANFKIQDIIHMKFQNIAILSFQITIYNNRNDI